MDVVIGTAGHIDHGKTALVKALTGVDADRLPEEKQRGITIDIGFAELDLGDVHASFVDVPGHERFVKNMLAGASGIDIVMLVVAADEGVMPQTREHFNICRLLGLRRGIVAITKADLADDETLELVQLDIAELVEGSFLEDAKVVVTSSAQSRGLDEVGEAIREVALKVGRLDAIHAAFLPVDRRFSVKGHGAVVTGTLRHGEIDSDSALEILPTHARVRVRGIQSHGRSSDRATAGRRVAVNLGGIDHSAIERGMVLAASGVFETTQIIDAEIELLADAPRPLRSRQRVRVHIGTAEILARVAVLNASGEIPPGSIDLVQFRLESPAVAVHGSNVIVRSYSPQDTIAGGRVLDPFPSRHRRKDLEKVRQFLTRLADVNISRSDLLHAFIARSGEAGISSDELASRTGWLPSIIAQGADLLLATSTIVDAGGRFMSAESFERLRRKMVAEVKRKHDEDPLAKGTSKETLRGATRLEVFNAVLNSLVASGTLSVAGDAVSLAERKQALSPAEESAKQTISDGLLNAGLEVPKAAELLDEAARVSKLPPPHVRKVLQTLIDAGEIVKISDDFYFARSSIDSLIAKLREQAKTNATIDVARFKEISGVSRKYAIPLLEYFDREKVTLRTGDKRVIR